MNVETEETLRKILLQYHIAHNETYIKLPWIEPEAP
jgi:hypothetical protein